MKNMDSKCKNCQRDITGMVMQSPITKNTIVSWFHNHNGGTWCHHRGDGWYSEERAVPNES